MKKLTTYFFMSLLLGTSAMAAVPFYSEDFASGLPGTWQNVDNNSVAHVLWRYTTTGAKNSFPNFSNALSTVGTSAANGYMIFDSDSAGGGGGEDASIISPAIDCSARTNVHLTF